MPNLFDMRFHEAYMAIVYFQYILKWKEEPFLKVLQKELLDKLVTTVNLSEYFYLKMKLHMHL